MNKLKANLLIGLTSLCIFSFVIYIVYLNPTQSNVPQWVKTIPSVNAFFNFLTSLFLILAIYFVKVQKNIPKHKIFIMCAIISSILFLIGYSFYHALHGDTKFIAQGSIRYIYFFLLISHIVLSFFQVPLILSTLYNALILNYETHKKLARITFPVWLYVSVTGIIVYIFLTFLNY